MNEVLNQNWLFNPQPLSAKPHKHTAFLDKHLNSIDTNNNFSRLKQNSRLIHKKTSAFMHQEHHQLNQLLESQENQFNQVQTDENKSNTVFKAYNKKPPLPQEVSKTMELLLIGNTSTENFTIGRGVKYCPKLPLKKLSIKVSKALPLLSKSVSPKLISCK